MGKIELPRPDHYERALQAAVRRLKERYEPARVEQLGAAVRGHGEIEVESLCWRFAVRVEPFSVVLLPGGETPDVVWQVLLVDYLSAERPRPPGSFVSFADFPGVRGYLPAFTGRVIRRLERTVGASASELTRAAEGCGGTLGSRTPLSYLFRFFPRFELQVLRHEGDEELSPSCNVLFSDNAPDLLSFESVIVAADKLVSSLQGKGPCHGASGG